MPQANQQFGTSANDHDLGLFMIAGAPWSSHCLQTIPSQTAQQYISSDIGIKHGSGKSVEIHYKFDHLPSGNLT